ncbi:MAG: hypothetical protein UX80_C0005G0049 [Candidatus Amesbacteria bacterium GW2011_GWA2_47_11b]|uniref:Glycosyltransferase RgtA/B/C/D-like domain-containing protein n=3 Tax=Candidatus Amesiibacteriota TaxID=1752730 RepID=A0A0G1VJP4_9BACT|nr:MAG: hypothetical protein UX42_C0001G0106 [Microgenomates group bacterium GW2011_GWC1_46_20]KKU58229.1 MAG: hypothetical protein UX80_C0005G0049 [Candidatus Amesbacteria bacterium GW2011_GWA2_47_11b]KKU70295.1 MAG: hypothetical protein UX92_C0002G0039 [Candidatus Amesbacteria bacterium GW2011_GWA1_47_20]KKU82886.1 MAG: hypothetical protein UY11_C0036G0012 [Candidatus Amesbacteria bacterium GW2011_GWC2_47_8]
MRTYQLVARYGYGHDGDLASWIIKDVVVDKHLRLVGQLTSSPGIYIGPLFYYSLIPFYFVTNMDPVGGLGLSVVIGAASLFSLYYVITKLHGQKMAVITTLFYAGSYMLASTDRGVVPTTPVMLWSIWFYYAIMTGRLYLSAFLFGLVWHIHLALGLLAPLVFFRKHALKTWIVAGLIFIVTTSPLILFETKHDFIQSRSLISSFTSSSIRPDYLDKLHKVIHYTSKNINNIVGFDTHEPYIYFLPILLLITLLTHQRRLIFAGWILLYIFFFTLHPILLSEYYLNGLNIIWLVAMALIVTRLSRLRTTTLLIAFLGLNLFLFLSSKGDGNGYVERKNVVAYIVADAKRQDFPCIAISYMTSPGRELGYRYFFWLKNLHVNNPDSGSPVYTIVFPHTRAGRLDATFGGLGVVLPDQNRYFPDQVKQSCSGANSNLTDPMFGFTK